MPQPGWYRGWVIVNDLRDVAEAVDCVLQRVRQEDTAVIIHVVERDYAYALLFQRKGV